MTDEQPTPPPIDLEKIEADVRGSGWQRALQQVPALVAEVKRLRADLELMTQERDAISTVFDAYKGDCDALSADLAAARAALAASTERSRPAHSGREPAQDLEAYLKGEYGDHTCPRCGVAKPRTPGHFYFSPRGHITGYCRSCEAERSRSGRKHYRDYRAALGDLP